MHEQRHTVLGYLPILHLVQSCHNSAGSPLHLQQTAQIHLGYPTRLQLILQATGIYLIDRTNLHITHDTLSNGRMMNLIASQRVRQGPETIITLLVIKYEYLPKEAIPIGLDVLGQENLATRLMLWVKHSQSN